MTTVNLEIEYVGNSTIQAPNFYVYVRDPSATATSSNNYLLIGKWSKSLLREGDRTSFTSSNFGKFVPELNKRYKIWIENNLESLSDEINIYCLNDDLHKVYKCIDGEIINTGEEAYCRD